MIHFFHAKGKGNARRQKAHGDDLKNDTSQPCPLTKLNESFTWHASAQRMPDTAAMRRETRPHTHPRAAGAAGNEWSNFRQAGKMHHRSLAAQMSMILPPIVT
jgi:hypothetical protein